MNGQNLYSKIAGLYDIIAWLNGKKRAANYIVSHLPFSASDSFMVLDAGCGTGLYSIAILKKFPKSQVVAFDLNNEMVERMRKNLQRYGFEKRASVFVGDVLGDIFSKEQYFNLVVTGGVLEYVDIYKAVQNLTRYLAIDGYFLNSLILDNWLGNLTGKWAGFKPHTTGKNTSAFIQNGFKLQEIITIPARYFPISLLKTIQLFKKQKL